MDYRATLNLPKTDFPMKANLAAREPEIQGFWESIRLYERIQEKNEGKEKFILHDGPPYTSGDLHPGTATNKVLKDVIVKFRSMLGFDAPYVPGYDMHGLPTEMAALRMFDIDRKAIDPVSLRAKCRETAFHYKASQTKTFQRLGVLGDWEHAYFTADPAYEATTLEVFARMVDRGVIFRGLRPVHWCPTCETALAQAELVYQDAASPSLWVKFPLERWRAPGPKGWPEENVFFIVWTTTPWTLPSNVAVAVHPDFKYALVRVRNGRTGFQPVPQGRTSYKPVLPEAEEWWVMAQELVQPTMSLLGISDYEFDESRSLPGAQVAGHERAQEVRSGGWARLRHPFVADREVRLVLADYVTLDQGTGCVHTAPGHGIEDFATGREYDLPVLQPLDDQGRFTEQGGQFAGLRYDEADPRIVETLGREGMLLRSEVVRHAYPHCWRCDQPVIFRATQQWFISLKGFTEAAMNAIEQVRWIPAWGKVRISSMVKDRPDWCISRQRVWGLPIPAFYCQACGEVLLTGETVRHVRDIFAAQGSDAWLTLEPSALLPAGAKCGKCGASDFRKETDTLDPWFESGSSHAAVLLTRPELRWPADLYIEGHDQHRGWFQSSLWTAIASRGQAPYRAVFTHGFLLDEEGREMHKRLGNFVEPGALMNKYGADVVRLWAASVDFSDDIRFSEKAMGQVGEIYRRLRNTVRFLLANLFDFEPDADSLPPAQMSPIDRWALHRLQEVVQQVSAAYQEFEFPKAVNALNAFCAVELSAFYLDVLKDRLYVSAPTDRMRRSAQTALFELARTLALLMAPVLSHTAEEIWQHLPAAGSREKSVHLADWPQADQRWLDEDLARRWASFLEIRDEVNRALEIARTTGVVDVPLEASVSIYCQPPQREVLEGMGEDLASLFIVSAAGVHDSSREHDLTYSSEAISGLSIEVKKAGGRKCARCWLTRPSVGNNGEHGTLCQRCVEVVSR